MWGLGWIIVMLSTFAADDEIVRRHDRPDADYLELGAQFPAVAQLGGRMGDGTLIRADWVLTAAHVADGMLRRGSRSVVLGGESYEARDIYLHPDWGQMGPHDVALIQLDRPVVGVAPMALYRGDGEAGEIAIILGHGRTGDGRTGPTGEDRRRRGATNRIETADDGLLVFVFDEGPDATELEGTPAGGDSGGPALLDVDGTYLIAGVSSMGGPGRNGPATYGARDYFARVSTYLGWLDGTLAGETVPSEGPRGESQVVEATRPVGSSPRETLLRTFVDALRPEAESGALDAMSRDGFSVSLQNVYGSGALDDDLAAIRSWLTAATELDVGFGGGGFELTILGEAGVLAVVGLEIDSGDPPRLAGIRLRR
ncbi:MAG: trypsin-like serine protease [Gemmatimonadota bacterium]